MKLPRRQFLHLAAGAVTLSACLRIAVAQTYPTRPVKLVVGFPPGGGNDIVARLIAQWLSERLGQPFVVENRPGAGTNIATEGVVRAQPDGYTLLFVAPSSAINATLYEKLSFNFIRDIAPVASLMRLPNVMEVNLSVPVKTVPEFIAYAKADGSKINMASPGVGTSVHLSGELFKMMAGVDMLHVPLQTPVYLCGHLAGMLGNRDFPRWVWARGPIGVPSTALPSTWGHPTTLDPRNRRSARPCVFPAPPTGHARCGIRGAPPPAGARTN